MTNEPLQLPYKYSGTALVSRDMIAASRHDILKSRREQLREQMALELFSKLIGAGPVVVNLTETMEPDLETRSVRVDVRGTLSRPDSGQATITTLRERLAAAEAMIHDAVMFAQEYQRKNAKWTGRNGIEQDPSGVHEWLETYYAGWLKPQPQSETAEQA